MREGELLALKWENVDTDARSLRVVRTLQRESASTGPRFTAPKTARSARLVPLGAGAVEALRGHRVAQKAERFKLGAAWVDLDLVFPNEAGKPMDAGNLLRRHFYPLLESSGLPRVRFHDLRHTAATLALGKGIHPKIVSDMLGHSAVGTTLDLYSHVTPTMAREAADTMDAVLSG